MLSQPFIFVGLGNPGERYQMTRHNIGFMVVKAFADRMGWSLKRDQRFNAEVAKGVIDHKSVHLIMPMTFMNLSGGSVRRYVDFYKIPLNRLLVIADDIALPFDQLRLKPMGSAGGHNGLKSIETHIGTTHYMRLRMGVGHPGEKMLADYVLEPFSAIEQEQLHAYIDRGVEVLQLLLKENSSHVMNVVNTIPRQPKIEKGPEREPIDLTKPPFAG